VARITFAWELGGAYGHLGQLIPVARALVARGHQVNFVLRELLEAERLLGPHGFQWLQAPYWSGRVTGLPETLSHAELLMRFGFLNPDALLGMCRAWRHQFELLAPDLVVFDYAPTALLASRGMGMARLNLATGFYVPPDARPLPPFRWWQTAPTARLMDSQQQVLGVVNQVLYTLGSPIVMSLLDVLNCEDALFTTLPALDHFPNRQGAEFVGPIFSLGRGESMAWPGTGALRIFAYLKPEYSALEPILDALNKLDASVVVHIPGVAKRTMERYTNTHMRISPQPLDIEQARSSCDWAVLHSGVGSTSAMLLAGKPLLLLPMQLEQTMFARSVEATGAAVVLSEASAGQFPRLIKRALADTSHGAAARAFAARHADHDQALTIERVVARCEALLAKRVASAA
jgi:hypothetical protein